ncbi:ATP-binding domain-containing protein [Pelobacter propionicus]|uniref:UvrD-like helicase C-terminal domain-containing protein n=1 Tax=Pelobacter propionicus (strain DSM 2379 / NBRC 103807 / OttBd1) TaxID=338966 RepID=A1AKK4_PELPD|nr:ATP-binding domain-containing protein [Pelobacter propionicus]ABK97874.1 hypothetical protein Ppro_0239 [Pelobacter propionicus DSM 2379]
MVEQQTDIKPLAGEVLENFERISSLAKSKLNEGAVAGTNAFASINTMTSNSTERLDQISSANRESYKVLSSEPAIARIMVADRAGGKKAYYICRTTAVSGIPNLASYLAPIGRLGSLEVGEEFKLPNGTVVEVLERSRLHPRLEHDGWDSRGTIVETEQIGPITIESLRLLLDAAGREEFTDDLLEQILAEENQKGNIIDGIRRSVITKMGLRDQPILDRYQDEIFRLPLDNRLFIFGPPGTGKTTTLIRRLGQKLDSAFLDDSEKRLVENVGSVLSHRDSWLMFTPTELLKQYLKEAFAREGVPASDLRIRTWYEYRRELARNSFGVLRTASGGGTFVLKDAIGSLGNDSLGRPIEWYEDFNSWQKISFMDSLVDSARFLAQSDIKTAQNLEGKVSRILTEMEKNGLVSTFESLAGLIPQIQELVGNLKEDSDKKIKAALNYQLNHDRSFLDEFARFLDGLQQAQVVDTDDQDDLEVDEEDDTSSPRTGRAAALSTYMQAVRAHARSVASKRSLGKTTRYGKIIDWLGDRILPESNRVEVGTSLLLQASARRFVNPVKRYIDGIPKRYRTFRRIRQEEGIWYQKEAFESRDLHPLELDLLLLSILRASTDILKRPNVQRNINNQPWTSLRPTLDLYRNQVLVDEVTDFSPLQLGCMSTLAHPQLRSFFACGDFHQRLTTWGTTTIDELKWVMPDFEVREITVAYRQSKQLNEFARGIIRTVHGEEQTVTLPKHVDNNGVAPALLEFADDEKVVSWLAERIKEIECFVGQLPSIAIFVNSENDVSRVAEALHEKLAESNIPVTACKEGQTVGQESNVRVFDVQHIKGLEFEVVFFVDIDKLATLHPQLFDKYLYVGTTRAATYLGLTCIDKLPSPIDTMREMFVTGWASLMVAS